MIDLSEVCGLPVQFDNENISFVLADDLNCDGEDQVKLSEIVPILLNKYLKYPEVVYKHRKNIFFKDNQPNRISYDMICIPFGLLGIEYIKTHVYYSPEVVGKYDCVIEVLQGEMIVVMQKNQPKEDEWQYDTYVEDLAIVTLKKGHKLAIPTGYFYTFVNTGNSFLIISRVRSKQSATPIDYSMLRREKGLACYIISKNAKIETVANPKYKVTTKLKAMSITSFIEKRVQEEIPKQIFKTKEPLAKIIDRIESIVLINS